MTAAATAACAAPAPTRGASGWRAQAYQPTRLSPSRTGGAWSWRPSEEGGQGSWARGTQPPAVASCRQPTPAAAQGPSAHRKRQSSALPLPLPACREGATVWVIWVEQDSDVVPALARLHLAGCRVHLFLRREEPGQKEPGQKGSGKKAKCARTTCIAAPLFWGPGRTGGSA